MYIGIDVGGMSIKAGIVSDEGKVLCKHSVPTPLDNTEGFCRAMCDAVDGVLLEYGKKIDIESIGVGAPGVVDRENGLLKHCSNIPYKNAPVREILKNKFGADVFVENDANCAAVGEFYAAKDSKNFIFVTLGTGVGGGIIINGKLFTGSNGAGGELGHMITHADGKPCTCGLKGCWEAYASTGALIRLTEENRENIEVLRNGGRVSGKTAFSEARNGDEGARRVRDEWIREISYGIINIVNIFQPDRIVIGGAVSKEGEELLTPLREIISKSSYTSKEKSFPNISQSLLGEDAGIIGAALLYKNLHN